jgi:hypothetical protein
MTTNPVEMSKQERMSFLGGVLDELRPRHAAGTLVTGGREALMLWEATVDAFVDENWVAALLCARATCERILGGLVSLHGMPGLAGSEPKDWERQWGLGKLIGMCESKAGWNHSFSIRSPKSPNFASRSAIGDGR